MPGRGYFRYIHIVMVIAAINCSAVGGCGCTFGTGGMTIPRFPPVACFARDANASYFAFVLPVSIINAIGASLLILILWTLITKVGNMKTKSEVSEGVELEICLSMQSWNFLGKYVIFNACVIAR